MAKVLMKGNEALAESCLRAGCRFFSVFNASRGRLGVLRLFESTIPHQSNEIRT